ncbi:MAG: hypothetical protein RI531_10100, partial [Haloferacaceae archaeon]|nr:hypothetical protein [Haloferacaceae archaeon]
MAIATAAVASPSAYITSDHSTRYLLSTNVIPSSTLPTITASASWRMSQAMSPSTSTTIADAAGR